MKPGSRLFGSDDDDGNDYLVTAEEREVREKRSTDMIMRGGQEEDA